MPQHKIMADLINGVDESIKVITPIPNDSIGDTVTTNSDVFKGMDAIDQWKGEKTRMGIRPIKELGLVAVGEINSAYRHFYLNDTKFCTSLEEVEAHGLIMLFHSSCVAAGSGRKVGGGVKLKYCQAVYLDVATDFSELKIISAHPSWPWTSAFLAIAVHKSNFYVGLSGWAPKDFPDGVM